MPTPQCPRAASVVNVAPRSTSSARRPDSRPDFGRTRFSCGSEPARDNGGSVCINTECAAFAGKPAPTIELKRSEEHTSELQSLMRNSYAVFCLKKKIK